jgi:DNA-binding transcriptional LysR family regulator
MPTESAKQSLASLAQLPLFVAVAEAKSFSRAATALGVSPSAVSQAVRRLERELGVTLLVRTTRSVNLTEAGARLFTRAGALVDEARGALAEARGAGDQPSGLLRLNVPRFGCRRLLMPLIVGYARAFPSVQVDVVVENRNVDIVKDGFDAGVRLFDAIEKDMLTIRVSPPVRFVVVGSPEYLARHGRPKHPRELVDHSCIAWRSPTHGSLYRWEFEQRGRAIEVGVAGPVTTNDDDVLAECARTGLGLSYVAEHEVTEELASGALETVLDAFAPRIPGLFLYYPRAARSVPKLASFVAYIRASRRGASR